MKKVAIDIDGVIRDIFPEIIEARNSELDPDCKPYTAEDITCWDLRECLGIIDIQSFFENHGRSIFLNSKPFKDAYPAIMHLSKHCEIILVSNRVCKANEDFTNAWLYYYGFGKLVSKVVYTANKNEVKSDVILDDYFGNIENHNAKHKFLFSQNHNKEITGFNRVKDLYDFINEFHKIIS